MSVLPEVRRHSVANESGQDIFKVYKFDILEPFKLSREENRRRYVVFTAGRYLPCLVRDRLKVGRGPAYKFTDFGLEGSEGDRFETVTSTQKLTRQMHGS